MSSAYAKITRDNAKRQAEAKTAGRLTFRRESIDDWPACVECGSPIRSRPFDNDRECGCPGVKWWCGMDGWQQRSRSAEEHDRG